uniref:Low-density lipoprotein receptor domain class A n=1 Tax=Panagrellus redivivus TaxID=6233 RepID=A0A7E4W6W2_PANRE
MMRLLLVAAAALLLPNVVAFSRAVSCDLEHEYSCGFQCIPLEFLCDNVRDCHNGLDEESCEYLHSCPIGDFMCRTGECVSSHFKCNGLAECSDGSD